MLKRKLSIILLLLAMLMFLAAFAATTAMAEGTTATIWTDKTDYSPAETVIIYGSGFNPEAPVNMTVARPDSSSDEWAVTSDSSGSFTATYLLDGIIGIYTVTATDGTNTATTTFTDSIKISSVSSSDSSGTTKTSFLTTDDVYATVTYSGGHGDQSVNVYIVTSIPSQGDSLSDFRGSFTTVTFSESALTKLAWSHPTTAGTYYIVLDVNQNGKLDSGDVISSSSFTVSIPKWYITVTSAHDTPTASDWVVAGADFTAQVTSLDVVAAGHRWVCTGHTIDEGSPESGVSHTFEHVAAAHTIVFNWQEQWQVTITADPSGALGGSFKVTYTLDGTTHTAESHTTSWSTWADAGTSVTVSDPESPIVSGDTRYVFDSYDPSATVTMTEAKTITLDYRTQYLVTYAVTGNAVPVTPPADEWVANGGVATGVFPGLVTVGSTRSRYVSDNRPASVTAPITVTATYSNEYLVTYEANVPVTLPDDEWVLSGQAATGVFPSPVISDGTKYVFVSDDRPSTITEPTTITATYDTYFLLTVNSAHDTPGGGGWYKSGDTAHATLTDGEVLSGDGKTKYVFTCWGDDASGTGLTSDDITMDAPKTATANWDTYFLLTVQTSGLSSASYPTNVKLGGSTVGTAYDSSAYTQWFAANAPSGTIGVDDTVAGGVGTRFVFMQWQDASTSNPRGSVTMDGPKTFTATYQTQYYLTVDNGGHGTAGGEGWYPENTNAQATIAPLTVAGTAGTRYVFDGWTDDATGSGSPSNDVYMDGPKTATATWQTQYSLKVDWTGLAADASGKVVTITVGGTPIVKNAGDSSYDTWLDAGTTVSYSFEPKVSSSIANKAYKLLNVAGTSTGVSHNFGTISGPISETGNYGSIILSITKKAPSAVFAGDTIRYVYEVRNTGTASATGVIVTDGSLTVTFVGGDFNSNSAMDPKETWVYTATYGPASVFITNTATLTCAEGATAQDTAAVSVYQLEVTKTAQTSFKRTYTWTISKTATPSSVTTQSGTATFAIEYDIKLLATFTDSDWKVTGTITIHNPAPIDAVITGVTDLVSPDIPATIDFGLVTFPYTLGAGQTLTLTYSADLPDAAARSNTATVTMQNYERPFLYTLTGDWVIRVYYGGNYDHDMTLTMASNGQAFTGTGGYPASGPPYSITETVTGVTAVNDVFWHSVYNTGYYWDAVGTIAPDGKMSGTWTSSAAQSGTWESIAGTATLVKTGKGTSILTGNADVDFSGATMTEVDKSVTVTDTYSGGPQGVTVTYSGTGTFTYDFLYNRIIGPYANIGIYTVKNTASFVASTTGTTGKADCTVTVYRIGSVVTDSSFYLFDFDNADGRQFKLILTPDVPTYPNLYRVTASNPGQFYYNIFYYAAEPTTTSFTITIPEPFVTQGANPVHIYNSISTSGDYMPPSGTDITYKFIIEATPTGFTITPTEPYSGPIYITIHLDYGYKKTLGELTKSDNNALGSTISIYDRSEYKFLVSGPFDDTDTIENRNVFKRDPGFAGIVTDSSGNLVQGVKVEIYGPDGKLLARVYTDEDGWYMYNYKHTGKAATYTIKLPDYKLQQSVNFKANSFVVVNFQI